MIYVGTKIKAPLNKYIFEYKDKKTQEPRWSMLYNQAEKTGQKDSNGKDVYAITERFELNIVNTKPVEDEFFKITKIIGCGQKTNLGADKKTKYYVTRAFVEIENTITDKKPQIQEVPNQPINREPDVPINSYTSDIEEDDLPF